MRIALIYTLKQQGREPGAATKPERPGGLQRPAEDAGEDFEDPQTIDAIAAELTRHGEVLRMPYSADLPVQLSAAAIDFAFNVCEGLHGRNRESHVPALLEMLGIPFSGSDPLSLGLTQDKAMAKALAGAAGVRVPAGTVVGDQAQLPTADALGYPLFVKPNHEGSSIGVRRASLVHDRAALQRQVRWLLATYRQPVLVEQFLPGAEYTVGTLGTDPVEVLPAVRVQAATANDDAGFYPFEAKGQHAKQLQLATAAAEKATVVELTACAAQLHRVFGLRDYGRLDFKLDGAGRPHFLEANGLPGLSPRFGMLPFCARAAGYSYPQLIDRIFTAALARNCMVTEVRRGGGS